MSTRTLEAFRTVSADPAHRCPECGERMQYCAPNAEEFAGYECECGHFVRDPAPTEYDEHDNGPTGHGDTCHSDADPGL